MSKSEKDYLKDLVAFKTVSAKPANTNELKKCAQYCADYFRSKGFFVAEKEYNDYPTVVATTTQTKSPKIFLQAHMDVVPADEAMFRLREDDTKLFGRGVFDMKFGCASYMAAIDKLEKNISKYDFGIMLTFDEEIGGRDGVAALLNDGYSSKVCILPDSGKNWVLESSSKGAWFVNISKHGKSAHGSEAHLGINAAEILNQVMAEILTLRDEYQYEDLSLVLSKFSSGKAINQVPDYAEASFDIRYKNEKILESIKAKMQKICEQNKTEVKTNMLASCLNISPDDKIVEEFINEVEDVLQKKITTGCSAGATDGRYFCEKNIPAIVIQPDGDGRHANSEWLDKKGFYQLTQIVQNYLEKCA